VRKNWLGPLGLLGLLIFLVGQVQARKFDFKDENISSYFRGGAGQSLIGKKPYESSSGATTRIDTGASLNLGGEFGFSFGLGPMAIRLGVELWQPQVPSKIVGTNVAGTQLFDLRSKILAFIPRLTIEYTLSKSSSTRWYIFVGGGLATVKVEQEYIFSTDGLSEGGFLDNGNYKERISKTTTVLDAGFGHEFLMVDNVTFFFDGGYKFFPVKELAHEKTVTTINGAVVPGDIWKDNDGENITLDLGGVFASIGFRFYIDF